MMISSKNVQFTHSEFVFVNRLTLGCEPAFAFAGADFGGGALVARQLLEFRSHHLGRKTSKKILHRLEHHILGSTCV